MTLVIVVLVKSSIDIECGFPDASWECVNAWFQSEEVPPVALKDVAFTIPEPFILPETSNASVGLIVPTPTLPLAYPMSSFSFAPHATDFCPLKYKVSAEKYPDLNGYSSLPKSHPTAGLLSSDGVSGIIWPWTITATFDVAPLVPSL